MKKSWKNAALALYYAFYYRNWVKIRENPLFSLKSRYLRSTKKPKAFLLESARKLKFGPVIENKDTQIARNHFFKMFIF